jgi:hypothetical protein
MRGAIMETVLHNVPVPASGYVHDIERDLVSNLHMSAVGVRDVRLVNLTSTGLRAAGPKHSDLFDGDELDYPRTREWAAWLTAFPGGRSCAHAYITLEEFLALLEKFSTRTCHA